MKSNLCAASGTEARIDLARAANIPLRTVQRREASHARRFERDESDRLARVARLYAMAEDVLGSRDEAQRWMKSPNRALDGMWPLDELDTEIAAREVEDLLGRIRRFDGRTDRYECGRPRSI